MLKLQSNQLNPGSNKGSNRANNASPSHEKRASDNLGNQRLGRRLPKKGLPGPGNQERHVYVKEGLKAKVNKKLQEKRANQKSTKNQKQAKKTVAQLPKGVVHIQSSFNNTIITVTNLRGRVIAWSSAGANGFKGARKSTPFAAKIAAKAAGRASFDQGLKLVKVMVKGGGSGRETAMRGLIDAGLQLAVIRDITGVPHNGCRPPKKRRV